MDQETIAACEKIGSVTPAILAAMLEDGDELALLDVREGGIYARGHLLFARSLPLSTLELHIRKLVPRRDTRVVLCDGGDPEKLARVAGRILLDNGYSDLRVLEGGVDGWVAAGFHAFQGVNVPSKAFGEYLEHHSHTPSISAEELAARLDAGETPLILDARTFEEYHAATIPGSISCPGAELCIRIPDLLDSPDRLIVVHCAGRTRGIVGAQSLINMGLPNPVVSLRNGTIGWMLAGFRTSPGNVARAPRPSTGAPLQRLTQFGRDIGRIEIIDWARYDQLRQDMTRSVFAFDVRGEDDYRAGRPEGFRWAPGAQLVQATDLYIGVIGSRIVLYDDQMVRARGTAEWLRRMGWREVYLLDPAGVPELVRGEEAPELLYQPSVDRQWLVQPSALLNAGSSVLVLDLGSSEEYFTGHIPGARFAIRSRLPSSLPQVADDRPVVLTSPDGLITGFAAHEVARLRSGGVRLLAGGTQAWSALGLPLQTGFEDALDVAEDMWHRPSGPMGGGKASMHEYIAWEVGLVAQIENEPGIRFAQKSDPEVS